MSRRNFAVVAYSIVALMLSAAAVYAQQLLQLGEMSYSRAPAPHLRQPVTRTKTFFRSVGGIAFSTVAQGEGGIVVHELRYDPAAPDGQRLVIWLGQPNVSPQAVRGRIHDWQLAPIARFSADENGSAMTLFGRLEDKAAQERVLGAQGRVINYHPALDNTLVGLRLMQADVLIFQPNAVHLFQDRGRIILGAGESGHDPTANNARFIRLAEWQEDQKRRGYEYQSYVAGDLDQRVTFSLNQGQIAFTGVPYWHAWRSKYTRDQITQAADRYDRLVQDYNQLLERSKARWSTMTPAEQLQTNDRLRSMGSQIDAMEKQLDDLSEVVEMPEYSRALSDRIRSLDGINPIVYATLTQVMRYRALFKHYQLRNADGFAAFLRSLERVVPEPRVTTPTVQYAGLPR